MKCNRCGRSVTIDRIVETMDESLCKDCARDGRDDRENDANEWGDYPTHPATVAADEAEENRIQHLACNTTFQLGDCIQHLKTKRPWTVVKLNPFTVWDYYRGRRSASPRNYRFLYRPVQ